jgi:hypothetical protein
MEIAGKRKIHNNDMQNKIIDKSKKYIKVHSRKKYNRFKVDEL